MKCTATKYKDKYDNVEGVVTQLLTKKVKVDLLTGGAKGKNHTYDKDKVTVLPQKQKKPPPHVEVASTPSSSSNAPPALTDAELHNLLSDSE